MNYTYHGKPCVTCGQTEKYISSQSCKSCTVLRGKHKLFDGTMDGYRSPEKTNARVSRWRKANPEKVKQQRIRVRSYQAAYQRGRNKRTANHAPYTANSQSILLIYREARQLTEITGIPHEVDHKIPICKGGQHHEDNLQILTMSDNRKKGGRL